MASPTSLGSTATAITTTARLIATAPAIATSTSTSTSMDTIVNALFFFAPLLSLVLAVLALSHRSRQRRNPNTHIVGICPSARRQALFAYAFIALLALLSTLAGALPFIHAGTDTASKAEAVVQALLSFLLGLPVFHLAAYYDNDNGDDSDDALSKSSTRRTFETLYSSILVITLTGATLTALLQQLLPSSSATASIELGRPLYLLPHALYLLYTFLALRRIARVLFRLLYPSSPSFFSSSCFSSFLHSSSSSSSSRIRRGLARSSSRRPITIHISTQCTSVPFSIASSSSSSPASPSSAASFPCPFSEIKEQPQRPIELALPKRKHKDTRSRLIDTDTRCLLYQDELNATSLRKKDKGKSALIAIDIDDIDTHRHPRQKRSKSDSIDSTSTASTVTAVDYNRQHSNAGDNTPTSATVTVTATPRRSSTPSLSSFPLITPPRAAYTSASVSGVTDSPSIPLLGAPASIRGIRQRERDEHIYTFPFPFAFTDVGNVSASTESTDDSAGIPLGVSSTISVAGISDSQLGDWGDRNASLLHTTKRTTRLTYSRATRRLLVILAAVQVVLIIGYACGIGGDIPSRLESSTPASSAPLRIIQAVCTVLAVTGTMAAYLLHAYNTHLSPSRSRSAAKSKSNPTSASTPLVSYNNHHTYHHQNYNNNSTTTNDVDIPNSSSSVIQIAETNPRPVLIQLAPPPPPRTRRKRVDAFATMPGHGIPVPTHERSRMDVPRSVSISVAGTTTMSGFVEPSVRYSGEGDRIGLGDALDGLDPYSYWNSNSYPYHHHDQQHLGYDGTPFDDHTSTTHDDASIPVAAYNAQRISQLITLTYEPPVMSGGLSMLETSETEGEVNDGEEDEDFEDVVDEGEYSVADHEGGEMGMYMEDLDGDLDLEDEMQKALSSSSSMTTSISGPSRGREHARTGSMTTTKRRMGYASAVTTIKAAPTKPKMTTKPKPKPKSPKAKKVAMEDPGMYIRKRGSMPVPPSATKKLFGFEFGWDHHQAPVPASGAGAGAKGKRQSGGAVKRSRDMSEKEVERAQESSFMDLKGIGAGASTSTAVTVAVGVTTRKLKRHSTPAGSVYARSAIGGGGGGGGGMMRKQEKWEEVFGVGTPQAPVVAPAVKGEKENGMIAAGMKKLKKKRSQSVTRPGIADDVVVSPARAGFFPGLPLATSSNPGAATLPHSASSNSNIKTPLSPSWPGTADSGQGSHGGSSHASKASLGSGSSMRRGLQLKRSFKLSVGRTLGPGLTLASAGAVGGGQEWEEEGRKAEKEKEDTRRRGRRSDESVQTDEDVDVDGEIRSIAAARLVSASIARVTPAATIVTAPSSAGFSTPSPPPSAYQPKTKSSPVGIVYPSLSSSTTVVQQGAPARPALSAIVTSPIAIPTASVVPFPLSAPASRRPMNGFSPVVQSPSKQQPHTSGSTWMPHPFADPNEQPMPNASSAKSYMTSGYEGVGTASVEDDVVQLEREMEEIRGRRGDGSDTMDSPTTQFRQLAEMAAAQTGEPLSVSAPTPSPGLSSSMTPSVTSMFALAHAQAQNVAPPPPPQPTEKEKAKTKLSGGGYYQKRLALSSPPVVKSDWGPQSSVVGNSGSSGGFLYRFPMIFPNSFSGSPPRSSTVINGNGNGNGQPNLTVPRPTTPRGGSTLRLSAMETVRSTFASVGARMSNATSRMSVTSSAGASLRNGGGHGFGEMIMEDIDGDFMDLRDPFASPPPASNIATVVVPASTLPGKKRSGKSKGGDGVLERNGTEEAEALKRKMSTWGKLPMPARSFSPASTAGSRNASAAAAAPKRHSFVNGRPVVRVVGKPSPAHHRKHKKERRSHKATLPSVASATSPLKVGSPEDADFGLEEALLSQRLLNRLDSDDWESRV